MSAPGKAIQTRYAGHHFRSRLEARWAVFFDVCGLRWEYEKEGYNLTGMEEWIGDWLHTLGCYLPDFWLPTCQMWVEIKPEVPHPHWGWTLPELQIWNLVRITNAEGGIVIFGSPDGDTKCSYINGFGKDSPDFPLRTHSINSIAPFHVTESAFDAAKSARFEFGEKG